MSRRPAAHNISTAQDVRDAAECAAAYLALQRCPGGRLIVKGYVCLHCDIDPSYGDCSGTSGFVKNTRND